MRCEKISLQLGRLYTNSFKTRVTDLSASALGRPDDFGAKIGDGVGASEAVGVDGEAQFAKVFVTAGQVHHVGNMVLALYHDRPMLK